MLEHEATLCRKGGLILGLSMRQLAELAGVSRGTIDRALNDRPGIAPEVRAKILQLAQDHGYRSNRAGRMLRLNKSPLLIGIQMPARNNPFFQAVRAGIEQAARDLADFGLSVVWRTMPGYDSAAQVRQVQELIQAGVHGLALVPIDQEPVRRELAGLAAQEIPVIALNNDVSDGRRLCYIGNDYLHSGRIAAGLLGLATGPDPVPTLILTGSNQILGHNQRVSGFRETVAARYPWIQVEAVRENLDDDALSFSLVMEHLDGHPELRAVYLAAGGVAGACRALAARGLTGRVRVVCFDLLDETARCLRDGRITAAISQEPERQGYLAVKTLYDYLLDGTRPPDRIITKNEIIIREHEDVSEHTAAGQRRIP